jgi:hypothetical protein
MAWKTLRLMFWDPKGEREWWPDFLFTPLAVVATLWFFADHRWLLGIFAGIVVLSLDELLWYLIVARKRRSTGA